MRQERRDVKAVHGDVQRLLKAGVIDKTDDGKIVFPYDAIHVDFTITKAAKAALARLLPAQFAGSAVSTSFAQ